MDVGWDPQKDRSNYAKHGVWFSDAEPALYDPAGVTLLTVKPISASSRPGGRPSEKGPSMRKEYDFSEGRRGAAIPLRGKTRITIFIDDDVLAAFRARAEAAGVGYQTAMNEALRQATAQPKLSKQPIDARTLRRILREEMGRSA